MSKGKPGGKPASTLAGDIAWAAQVGFILPFADFSRNVGAGRIALSGAVVVLVYLVVNRVVDRLARLLRWRRSD